MKRSIAEFDTFFLSYDEPNAEKHFVDLLEKCCWADRVQGVKGFDAVHRAAAEASHTDWFVTVDADNIVDAGFFEQVVELDHPKRCLSFNGRNMVNGLSYGNGGLKLWSRDYVLTMNTHENADNPRKAVDFCWEDNYRQVPQTFSQVWINGSPFQAFRVGFREGVKLSLDRGNRVAPAALKTALCAQNLRNLKVWCCIGSDMDNGLWAMIGARLGLQYMCEAEFDHTVVRDYDWFDRLWPSIDALGDPASLLADLKASIKIKTGILLPTLDAEASAFFRETNLSASK